MVNSKKRGKRMSSGSTRGAHKPADAQRAVQGPLSAASEMVGLELEEKGNHLDASNGHEGESSLQDPSQNIEAAANNDMLQHIGDVTTQGRHKSFSWQSILDENSRLREERNKAREVLQDTQSKLRDSHERLEKLQTEALSSVDRFQPAFDEHIVSRFNDLVQTMKPIGSYLANQKQQIDPRRWGTAVLEYLRVDAINKAAPRFNYDEKSIRKKVLKAVTWQFLENTVFGDPFLCFGTEVAHQAREMYHVFYEDPYSNEDSGKWRSMTVQALKRLKVETVDVEVRDCMMQRFDDLLDRFGYDFDGKLQDKVKVTLDKAIAFAQLLAEQRAIFGLYSPRLKGDSFRKKANDPTLTNIDNEFDDDDEEREGEIWFVVSPGLVKYGNGAGRNLKQASLLTKAFVQLV